MQESFYKRYYNYLNDKIADERPVKPAKPKKIW